MTINYCCYGMYADVGHSPDCKHYHEPAMTNPTPQTPPDSIEKIADLLPCPFCGAAPLKTTTHRVFCANATCCLASKDWDCWPDQWNLRALPSAELERDAGRYRYIRSGECHIHSIWFQSFGERFNLMESDLDDSVDAAIARAKEAKR